MTPSLGPAGEIVGYHSNRRSPRPDAVAAISPRYDQLARIEREAPDRKAGMEAAFNTLVETLSEKSVSYDEFVLSL